MRNPFTILRRHGSKFIFVVIVASLLLFQAQNRLLDRENTLYDVQRKLNILNDLDIQYSKTHTQAQYDIDVKLSDDVTATTGNHSDIYQHAFAYNLQAPFKVCSEASRPNANDIVWRKNVYQQFPFRVTGHGDFDAFTLYHYFDDRFFRSHGQRFLRATVVILGPGPLDPIEKHRDTLRWAWAMNKVRFNVLLWYDGFHNAIATTCEHKGAAGLTRNVSNSYYFQQIMHCPVPEIDHLPSHTSFTRDVCTAALTYTRIVYPRPARYPGARDIGVCMASLYGTMNRTRIPYIVNWMEALKMFGVIEVSMNNASFEFADDDIARTFQYYIDRGELTMTHFPVIHERWSRSRKYDDDASESVNKVTTGDCFYRNLKRYWYTLIIDVDELPVPRKHSTYRAFLEEYLAKNQNLTHAHCLVIRTAFFYMDFKPGNPSVPMHLPVLRYTNRFRPEPIEDSHDGVGISKSFHNPRNCVASGHHLCRQGHERLGNNKLVRQTMPTDDILVHHYRAFCKYKQDCKQLKNQLINDKILPERFGTEISARVEKVMRELGFL